MEITRLLIGLIACITSLGITWSKPVLAALPPGNALKDPYAILRNALPIEQKDLRELQHQLEDTSNLVRGCI